MWVLFIVIMSVVSSFNVALAGQDCWTDSIPATTPNTQLVDNGDGTVTDLRTGLIWKQCLEGLSGTQCDDGLPAALTWQEALARSGLVNASTGFAGYYDWRLPNIKELRSIVEHQCHEPAINIDRFPGDPGLDVWSGSPDAYYASHAWFVYFSEGYSTCDGLVGNNAYRSSSHYVRLVRGGQ